MDAENADDIILLANIPTQAKSLPHSLEQEAGGIGLHIIANKIEYMCFHKKEDISTLNGGSLKLVDKFTYFSSSVSFTENDIICAYWRHRLLLIGYRSYGSLTNSIKKKWFLSSSSCVNSTVWMHQMDTDEMYQEKARQKLFKNAMNKSRRQHPTKQLLYGHLPLISKTIQKRQTRHAGHC